MDNDLLPDEVIDLRTIESALASTRARIAERATEIARLGEALTTLKREESLLEHLRALRSGDPPSSGKHRDAKREQGKNSAAWHHLTMRRVPAGAQPDLVEEAVSLLAEHGRPVHISELMRVLLERGVKLPGAGTQANLISRLRRDPQIVRPSRGMYALAAWGLADMKPRDRRQRRTKRRSAKKPN